MTLAILIVAALALGLGALALFVAAKAHGLAVDAQRQLARHRHSHAERAEEAGASRHSATPGPPPEVSSEGPATSQLERIDAGTTERPAVRLPRPGKIGPPA